MDYLVVIKPYASYREVSGEDRSGDKGMFRAFKDTPESYYMQLRAPSPKKDRFIGASFSVAEVKQIIEHMQEFVALIEAESRAQG